MVKLNPKVSIVIPVYNGANFLAEAIDSALGQTYSNVEVVVVNDGSNDRGMTEKVALSYGDQIKYYKKENGGVGSALNFGIKKMTGEYFSWLSHDDLYESTKIEEEVNCLFAQSEPENMIVACNSVALFENGLKKKEKIERSIFDNYIDIFLGASAKVGLNGCSLLIPRSALLDSGGFNVNLPVTQDYDLWSRLVETCKFVLLDRYLVMYRHHDMQDSVRKADTSLAAGDELRAHILQGVSKKDFGDFIQSNSKNEKWVWENYGVYKSRGYIKTSLVILRLLAEFYSKENSKKFMRLRSDVAHYENVLNIQSHDLANDSQSVVRRIDIAIKSISDEIYLGHVPREHLGKVGSYIESIKNDGFGFFVQKVYRKLIRILRELK